MKKVIFAAVLAAAIQLQPSGAAPRFEKVSDHCYYMQLSGGNVGAVITDEGILMVNPPQEADLFLAVEALKRVTPKAVRWVVFTDPRLSRAAGAGFYAGQGAQVLASTRLQALSLSAGGAGAGNMAKPETKTGNPGESPLPWIAFDSQMHVFPSNLDVRIYAVQQKALTGGDVIVHVPAEKILFVGSFYEAARYPDIDTASEGSAAGWIDGMKQVIDSVPVLKSAIPQPMLKSAIPQAKPESKPEQEKKLEEGIMVVSAHGGVSNLQNMKDLLEACQKLRNDVARAIRLGRSCEGFLASPASEQYRGYENLAPFASQLFEALRRPQ